MPRPAPALALDPTPEQEAALEAFGTGEPLVIEAGAGTGKTTTLSMLARSTRRGGTYLAFNRAAVQDVSGKMPATVDCRTIHSVANRAVRRQPGGSAWLNRLNLDRQPPWELASLLGLKGPIEVKPEATAPTRRLQDTWQAGHVMRALAAFCASADVSPGPQHFPYVDGLDVRGPDGRPGHEMNHALAMELLPALERAWADMADLRAGRLRLTHDVYVKMAQLNAVAIGTRGSYVLVDEAQDTSPVMLDWLGNQPHVQLVYVGDSQQQIYGWRGAVNALAIAAATPGVLRTMLTHSWRFGAATADLANAILTELDADLRIVGRGPDTKHWVTSSGPQPDAVLCRSNAVAIETLMDFQQKGKRVHLVGGGEEAVRFAAAAAELQAGGRTSHPELACFETWEAVQTYVADDPQGSDLALMVKLMDEYGPQIVIDALDGMPAEDAADLIVSTAHKAKGREWPGVRIARDFTVPEKGGAAERRLMYVAATRATHDLDISACEYLSEVQLDTRSGGGWW